MERHLPQKPPPQKRGFARSSASNIEPARSSSNLALFPFSALLPHLSEINELIAMIDSLKERQVNLLESKNAEDRNLSKEERSKRSAEELMINQVFQWLHVVQGQEDEDE